MTRPQHAHSLAQGTQPASSPTQYAIAHQFHVPSLSCMPRMPGMPQQSKGNQIKQEEEEEGNKTRQDKPKTPNAQ